MVKESRGSSPTHRVSDGVDQNVDAGGGSVGLNYQEERRSLREFQTMIKQRGITISNEMVFAGDMESTLLRFLRARKFELEKSLQMLESTVKWRHEHDVDSILQHPLPKHIVDSIRDNKPACYIGFDRAGRPIYVDRIGLLNQPRMEKQGVTEDDFIKYHIQEMEYMGRVLLREASERSGRTVDQVTMIMDLKGVTLSHFSKSVRQLVIRMFSIDSDNYPETNGGTYVVNIPTIFSIIWGVLEPFLDKRTRAKIQLMRGGDHMKRTLLQAFDADSLPTFLGGNLDFDTVRTDFTHKVDRTLHELTKQEESRQHAKDHPRPPMPTGHQAASSEHFITSQPSREGSARSLSHAAVAVETRSGTSVPTIATGMVAGNQFVDFSDDESFYTPKSVVSRSGSFSMDGDEGVAKFGLQMPPPQYGSPAQEGGQELYPRMASLRQASNAQLPRIGEDEVLINKKGSCCTSGGCAIM